MESRAASSPGHGPAARVLLRPLGAPEPSRLASSARAVLDPAGALFARDLAAGDVVTAEGVSFVVHAVDPPGARRADASASEVEFDLAPAPAKRAVADLVFLLDSSWSMRKADLPPTRLDAVKRAATTALANVSDVARGAAVLSFGREPFVVSPLGRVESLDVGALDALAPRGPGDVAQAVSGALAYLAREGDPANEHVVLLATDGTLPLPQARESGARAARLGVRVHVLDAGSPQPAPLEALAEATGGTYHDAHGGCTFRPALNALAQRFGVPLSWRDPARSAGEVEFEVVLRAMSDKEDGDFPAVPRRLRRK